LTATRSQIHIPITKPVVGEHEQRLTAEVIESGWLTQGERTFEFERLVADYCGASHAVAANSATTALHVALVLLGLGPGDEVLCPSYTHIATANSIRYTGATPVFVDIREDTFNIDERLLEAMVTDRTRAVLPVHQVGLPAEMDAVKGVAARHGLAVVEDAACALGSTYGGRRVGSLSTLTVFSFHPRKVITTGEGGMLLTDDGGLAETARSLISHGESVLDVHRHAASKPLQEGFPRVGFNYRLTNVQGALGVAQMSRLDELVDARRRLGRRYNDLLAGTEGVRLPVETEKLGPNYQSYMVRLTSTDAAGRDRVMAGLREAGIASRPGITAIHREPIYRNHVRAALPETESAADSCLILPLYPQMTDSEQDQVVSNLTRLLERIA
jgi:perosamine synthetase